MDWTEDNIVHNGINVVRGHWLPPNTMVVSDDIYEQLKDPDGSKARAEEELRKLQEASQAVAKLMREAKP